MNTAFKTQLINNKFNTGQKLLRSDLRIGTTLVIKQEVKHTH